MSMTDGFRIAHASGGAAGELMEACLGQLLPLPATANFGLIYVTDRLGDDLPNLIRRLRVATQVADWAGSVGIGIVASGIEYTDEPAIALLVGCLPAGSFRLFGPGEALPVPDDGQPLGFGLVHGDPRTPDIATAIRQRAHDSAAYLAGGLSSSRGTPWQVAGRVVEGGLSGVLFDDRVPLAAGLTQGCSPIGPIRQITRGENNIIHEIGGRPALEVFKQDIGELFSRDLKRALGVIFAALPVTGSDTGDYLVRNVIGIDPSDGRIAIGGQVETGDPILFCRRDRAGAALDLDRMLTDLKRRTGDAGRAGVYFSCVGRGQALFGGRTEMAAIREVFGNLPVVGFFGNGEIAYDRIYGYTGVLALFV